MADDQTQPSITAAPDQQTLQDLATAFPDIAQSQGGMTKLVVGLNAMRKSVAQNLTTGQPMPADKDIIAVAAQHRADNGGTFGGGDGSVKLPDQNAVPTGQVPQNDLQSRASALVNQNQINPMDIVNQQQKQLSDAQSSYQQQVAPPTGAASAVKGLLGLLGGAAGGQKFVSNQLDIEDTQNKQAYDRTVAPVLQAQKAFGESITNATNLSQLSNAKNKLMLDTMKSLSEIDDAASRRELTQAQADEAKINIKTLAQKNQADLDQKAATLAGTNATTTKTNVDTQATKVQANAQAKLFGQPIPFPELEPTTSSTPGSNQPVTNATVPSPADSSTAQQPTAPLTPRLSGAQHGDALDGPNVQQNPIAWSAAGKQAPASLTTPDADYAKTVGNVPSSLRNLEESNKLMRMYQDAGSNPDAIDRVVAYASKTHPELASMNDKVSQIQYLKNLIGVKALQEQAASGNGTASMLRSSGVDMKLMGQTPDPTTMKPRDFHNQMSDLIKLNEDTQREVASKNAYFQKHNTLGGWQDPNAPMTPEQARKLPPGTQFYGTDGHLYVR